jgi:hypothetical protein
VGDGVKWSLEARYGSLSWSDEDGLGGDVDVLEEWAARTETVQATPTGPFFWIDPLPDDGLVAWYAAVAWADTEGGGLRSSKPPENREPWADEAPDDAIF